MISRRIRAQEARTRLSHESNAPREGGSEERGGRGERGREERGGSEVGRRGREEREEGSSEAGLE